jgi:hypothetical protein
MECCSAADSFHAFSIHGPYVGLMLRQVWFRHGHHCSPSGNVWDGSIF